MAASTPSTKTAAPLPSAWRYDATIDEALSVLLVTLCFEGPGPRHVIPGEPVAYRFLRDPALQVGDALEPLVVNEHGIVLPPGNTDACLRYAVDVAAAGDLDDRDVARRVGSDLVLTHDVWLWRPAGYASDAVMRLRLTVPPPLAVSSPWPLVEGETHLYEVPRSTLKRRGYTAFGRFTVSDVRVPGGVLHVAVLDGPLDNGRAPVMRWVERAGRAVSHLYGRFPREHTQVMVTPAGLGTGSLFGWVVRGGGPSVNLLIGRWADEESLALDEEWIAVHEMSHIAIPFVSRGEPWLSEGIATWYQNVLRARAGEISERDAWVKLVEGFARGRSSVTGNTLLEDSRDMHENRAYWRVYWAGTALAMLADVEIRRATNGERSLDSALEDIRACCLDTDVTMSAVELCQRMDAAIGQPIFTDIARAGRAAREFPDTDAVLRALGVIDLRGRVVLDDRAPLAELRRQIMSPRPLLEPEVMP